MPRRLPEFTYPKGLLLRRVDNSGDIGWHKNRVFISEVFRGEELALELITQTFRVLFRKMEIGKLNADEYIGLNASTEERAMMSSWRVTLLALGSAEATDLPGC